MNRNIRLLTLAAVALALFSSVGCDKLRARDQLNKGVTAYKNAKYEEAIDHFQQSVALDPGLINAKMSERGLTSLNQSGAQFVLPCRTETAFAQVCANEDHCRAHP